MTPNQNDLRYRAIYHRLCALSVQEIKRIQANIDLICFDEFNYDAINHTFCPIAIAMGLDDITNPTNETVQQIIGRRFHPVNILKGVPGTFYTTNRRQDLLSVCEAAVRQKLSRS